MKQHRSVLLASLLISVVSTFGCKASSHQRVPFPAQDVAVTSPDLARIYFVREDSTHLHLAEIVVYDGTKEIGALTSDTYLCWERPGGRTLGRAWYEARDVSKGQLEGIADLNCAAGRAYYFNVVVNREGGKPEVSPIDPEEGRALVAKRRPADQR